MTSPATSVRARHDGWTFERQFCFVTALVECGNVTAAAARAGMSKQSLYRLRGHPGAADFCAAWAAAAAEYDRRRVAMLLARRAGGVMPRRVFRP